MNAISTRIATWFKPFLSCAAVTLLAGFLCQCSNFSTVSVKDSSGGYQANYGPFDKNGDYVDNWADNPPKRRYQSRPTPIAPPVQQPQQYLVKNQWQQPTPVSTQHNTGNRVLLASSNPVNTQYNAGNHTHAARVTHTPPAPRPASRPTAVTVKPRIPAPTQHTVQPKETLYRLSVRYSTSVEAIKRANNLRNNNINIGQRLTIPRG